MQLRVLVYNVKSFRFGVRNASHFIAEHAPDLALIQECGPRYRLRRFAAAVGMQAASEHFFFLRRSIHDAVLVRPPWRIVSHSLHRFPKDGRAHPRGALVARIGRAGIRFWAVSVHLGLRPRVRERNVDELMSLVLSLDEPAVVGGDLNEDPEGKAVRWVSERMTDCWVAAGSGPGETFRADEPRARIDYLFSDERFRAARAHVLRGPEAAASSDHLPLLVDLHLPG